MAGRWRYGASFVGGLAAVSTNGPAGGQTTLPAIVITAPSPILHSQAPANAAGAAGEAAADNNLPPIVGHTFSPLTLIPGAAVLRAPASTLGNVLFATPGVTGSSFAPGASRPVIRGLDNARVRVQENGIGAMDVSVISEDHAVPIDPLTSDALEVIRGPATLRWGPQAIGGVVAASNNRIPTPMTLEGIHGQFKGALNSVDRGREGAVAVDARASGFAIHADYFHRRSEDYAIPGGRQANTAVDAQGGSIGASYIFNDGFIGISVANYTSLYGIPGIDAAADRVRIDLDQTKVTSRGEFRPGGSLVDTIRFWLGYTDYKHDERARDNGVDFVAATFKNREAEGRIEAQFVPIATGVGVLTSAFGIQAGRQELGTSGEAGSLLAPSETQRFAAYLFNELAVAPDLRLQAAGRIGAVSVDGMAALFPANFLPDGNPVLEEARRRSFVPLSASFGVLKDLPAGLVATATVSHSQRPPEAQELFSKGPHEASGTFEIGDPDLGKEAATSFEIGLKRPKGDLRFEATAFHTRYHGFIFKRLTGNSCGEEFDTCIPGLGEELRQVVFDQKDATFTGAEFAVQLDLLPVAGGTFGIDGQYDFVRAKFSDGTNVPRIPPHRLGGGVYWRDGNWFARVNLLHAFAQDRIAPEETPTPGYNLLGATLAYTHRFGPGDVLQSMTVGLVGTNLLNDDVRNHTSFKKDEVLLAGANVRLFANVKF